MEIYGIGQSVESLGLVYGRRTMAHLQVENVKPCLETCTLSQQKKLVICILAQISLPSPMLGHSIKPILTGTLTTILNP